MKACVWVGVCECDCLFRSVDIRVPREWRVRVRDIECDDKYEVDRHGYTYLID